MRDKLQPLEMKYQKEKERVDEIRGLKQECEKLKIAWEKGKRRKALAQAAKLYRALKETKTETSRKEAMGKNLMLTESVGPDQIAEVR